MPVTADQVAALRAYLSRDNDEADRLNRELVESGAAEGIAELVYAAFVIASRQKFPPGWSRGEVIRFVAQVRALLSERPDILDPLAAEHQLRRALGESVTDHSGEEARARAQVVLLDALIQSMALDDVELARLLGEAQEVAGQILSRNT
jgi:hypothetical protein